MTVSVAAQSGVTSIATGTYHTVALKSDGSVLSWGGYHFDDGNSGYYVGDYNFGQTTVPMAAQSGITAIAAGTYHTVALKNDGSVLAWKPSGITYHWDNGFYYAYDFGQTTVPVAAQSGVIAIAAGRGHTVALKSDGSVLSWGHYYGYEGDYNFDQTTVPIAAQSWVTAIVAGNFHTVALRNDGSVLAWGDNQYGQTTVPVAAQSGVIAIAAGGYHTVALKNDGSVVAWGNNNNGQTNVPVAAQGGVTAIAAGGYHTVALFGTGTPSFLSWAASFGLSGAADADPDNDGLANALEYILGGNPSQPSPAAPRPTASLTGDSMLFTFSRTDESETPDVSLAVESGTDLVTWPDVFIIGSNAAASSPGVTILENGSAPDTVTVAIPAGSGNARFARLRATIAR